VIEDTEKAELLNSFFASVFTSNAGPQPSQSLKVREKAWRKEELPLVEEDWVKDHLSKLDTHKSMGPHGKHTQVLRELQMSLLSHSPLSLKGPGEQKKCLMTGGKAMSLQPPKKARRRIQGTTGRSASPPFLEG